jgi:ABC-type multidrug transport system fused ATPase/permease subunit
MKYFLIVIFAFIAEMCSVKALMNSSRELHNRIFNSILHAKLSFFESTPLGRIINRFSKDIEAVEVQMPVAYKDFFYTLFDALTTLVLISITIPWFLAPLLPLSVIYVFIQVC